jgi:hypothetical protein
VKAAPIFCPLALAPTPAIRNLNGTILAVNVVCSIAACAIARRLDMGNVVSRGIFQSGGQAGRIPADSAGNRH